MRSHLSISAAWTLVWGGGVGNHTGSPEVESDMFLFRFCGPRGQTPADHSTELPVWRRAPWAVGAGAAERGLLQELEDLVGHLRGQHVVQEPLVENHLLEGGGRGGGTVKREWAMWARVTPTGG